MNFLPDRLAARHNMAVVRDASAAGGYDAFTHTGTAASSAATNGYDAFTHTGSAASSAATNGYAAFTHTGSAASSVATNGYGTSTPSGPAASSGANTYAGFTHTGSAGSSAVSSAAGNTYAGFTHTGTGAAKATGNGILATANHFNSYYSAATDRNGVQPQKSEKWKLPVIIVAAVVGALLIFAILFFLIRRRKRRSAASYRNIQKPTMGEHRDVFDARISEALESEAHENLSTAQRDADYAHPYGEVDTSYRGPVKPYTEKAYDAGA